MAWRLENLLAEIPQGAIVREEDLPGTPHDRATALPLWERRNKLVRLGAGLYWRPVPGRRQPCVREVLDIAVGRGRWGPSGLTALGHLGVLTGPKPPTPSYAVVSSRPVLLRGLRIVSRANLQRCGLTHTEVALLEALIETPRELRFRYSQLLQTLRRAIADGQLRRRRMLETIGGEDVPSLARRLEPILADLAGDFAAADLAGLGTDELDGAATHEAAEAADRIGTDGDADPVGTEPAGAGEQDRRAGSVDPALRRAAARYDEISALIPRRAGRAVGVGRAE